MRTVSHILAPLVGELFSNVAGFPGITFAENGMGDVLVESASILFDERDCSSPIWASA